jgi:hypothetical protein
MAFRLDLLRHRAWSAHLTEDLEFQLRLLLDDVVVAFAPDAIVRAQMPSELDSARTQNERWERGRIQLLKSFGPRLIRSAVGASSAQRCRLVDATFDLAVPPLSVLGAATAAASTLAATARVARRTRVTSSGVALAVLSCAGVAFHVVAGLRIAGEPMPDRRTMLAAPRLVLWKVGVWANVMAKRREVTWIRTSRDAVAAPLDAHGAERG